MKNTTINRLFAFIFGWQGYTTKEQEFLVYRFANVEKLSINELEKLASDNGF